MFDQQPAYNDPVHKEQIQYLECLILNVWIYLYQEVLSEGRGGAKKIANKK